MPLVTFLRNHTRLHFFGIIQPRDKSKSINGIGIEIRGTKRARESATEEKQTRNNRGEARDGGVLIRVNAINSFTL